MDPGGADTALEQAFRYLGPRDRTSQQVRAHLASRDHEPEAVEEAIAYLEAQGYVDDALYARRFAQDRRRLDHWGAERIERRLLAAGIAPEHIEAALAEQDEGGELAAALELLRRRHPEPPATDRDRHRALSLLVRRGYDLELAHDAVRSHARGE